MIFTALHATNLYRVMNIHTARNVKRRRKKMLKVGIVGLGQIGAEWEVTDKKRPKPCTHLGAYLQFPEQCEIVSLCDTDESKLNVWNDVHLVGAKRYTDYVDMINGEKLDILSICTPDKFHLAYLDTAIDKGVKVIFCEKPIALDPELCRVVVKNAEKKGVKIAVNHTRRWDPFWYTTVYGAIQGDELIKAVGYSYGDGLRQWTHMADTFNMLGIPEDKIEFTNIPGANYLVFEFEFWMKNKRVTIMNNGINFVISRPFPSPHYDDINELILAKSEYCEPESIMKRAVQDVLNCVDSEHRPRCTGEHGVYAVELALKWMGK